MTASVLENRTLQMHPKLLLDVIKRQAGTLYKAFLEGSMNAVEAGASKVETGLEETSCTIQKDSVTGRGYTLFINDDGRGIQSKDEVTRFFETFGQPHEASENCVWKQFRMGRGQLFAFGKNIWRTCTYQFTVDIKNWGLNWELVEGLPFVKGCQIRVELYDNPIKYSTKNDFVLECAKQVKYFETEVYFDGKMINTPPSNLKWEYEDENCYANFDYSAILPISIYNLGAFVMDKDSYVFGMGGIVVSKKRLDVNFARNDILESCPVYTKIKDTIRSHKKIRRKTFSRRTLSNLDRYDTLKDLLSGNEDYENIKNLRLVKTSQSKYLSLEEIRKSRLPWAFSESGSRRADTLIETHKAIVFDSELKTVLNYDGEDKNFLFWLSGENEDFSTLGMLHKSLDEVWGSKSSNQYVTIPWENLTPTERNLCKTLEQCPGVNRKILIGFSDDASAWTDGSTYVCFDRNYLDELNWSWTKHTYRLFETLVHELSHDDNTAGTHSHGFEFLQRYFEIMQSYDCPFSALPDFHERRGDLKKEERRNKERLLHSKAEQKLKEKLGFKTED